MICLVEWETFLLKYLNTSDTIFVYENDMEYEFYCTDGVIIVKCVYPKHEDAEKNFAFVDRYFAGRRNAVKVIQKLYEGQVESQYNNEYTDDAIDAMEEELKEELDNELDE